MCVHVCLPHLLSSPFFSIFLFNFYLLESPPLLLSSLNEIPFPLFHPRHFTFIFSTKPWLLIGENAIFCVILQDFPVNDASDYMCLPTIHFHPPPHLNPSIPSLILHPHIKRGEIGREQGEQQENSGWDSAGRSVVARAERMACCVEQQQYCVSGLSPPLSSVLLFFNG